MARPVTHATATKMSKPKYTVEEVETALINHKGLLSLAAKALGCDRMTVYRYVKRHKSLQAVVDEQRSHVVDTAELALMNAILDKQGWAVCFTLKTLGKDRGYVERSEVTGKDGGPVEHSIKGDIDKIYGNGSEQAK